jgi:hypothetical protein
LGLHLVSQPEEMKRTGTNLLLGRSSGANVMVDLTNASGGVERGSWCGRPDRRHPMDGLFAACHSSRPAQPEASTPPKGLSRSLTGERGWAWSRGPCSTPLAGMVALGRACSARS